MILKQTVSPYKISPDSHDMPPRQLPAPHSQPSLCPPFPRTTRLTLTPQREFQIWRRCFLASRPRRRDLPRKQTAVSTTTVSFIIYQPYNIKRVNSLCCRGDIVHRKASCNRQTRTIILQVLLTLLHPTRHNINQDGKSSLFYSDPQHTIDRPSRRRIARPMFHILLPPPSGLHEPTAYLGEAKLQRQILRLLQVSFQDFRRFDRLA